MLKKIRVLFLGLVVLAGSACVTPTHASSASSVVLTYVQAAGPSGAKDELVVIYNNSNAEVDITDWCVTNKSSVIFACFEATEVESGIGKLFLPAYSYATIASNEYLEAHSLTKDAVSAAFDVTNQSSGSIVNSTDSVSLVNASGDIIDMRSWTSAPVSGKAWVRMLLLSMPDIYANSGGVSDWGVVSWAVLPPSNLELRIVETEPEVEGPEEELPELVLEPGSPLVITEILANAAGADAGKEFIELFNNSETSASLYGLKLRVGLESAKWHSFPAGSIVPPLSYVSFSDIELGFSLVNTHGGVQLYKDDQPLGERIEYTSPKEDTSWAFIEEVWQYTNHPTPGSANSASRLALETAEPEGEATQKPCASNQFRNPETGRCKLLGANVAASTACKKGQVRNPETNRCRTIAPVKTSTPCKEGQERNPDTNRCRTITKMSNAAYGVKGIKNKSDTQPSWYYLAGILGVVVLVLGYGVWEWREELLVVWRRLKTPFAKH